MSSGTGWLSAGVTLDGSGVGTIHHLNPPVPNARPVQLTVSHDMALRAPGSSARFRAQAGVIYNISGIDREVDIDNGPAGTEVFLTLRWVCNQPCSCKGA